MNPPRTILVAIDLGDHAATVLEYAVALAGRLEAALHIFHAASWPTLGTEVPITPSERAMNEIVTARRRDLQALVAAHAAQAPFAAVVLEIGEARALIFRAAEQLHADLIVMGTHGRRGVSRLLLGSVAEEVARTAPCPVLLVRSGPATVA